MTEALPLTDKEVIELAAINSVFFCETFFPGTARQKSPEFHYDVWDLLDGPNRLVNVIMARGWGKTSMLRMYLAKRMCYGLSRTILLVSKSQPHSRRTLRWVRNQIKRNQRLTSTYGLRIGSSESDDQLEIVQTLSDGSEIHIWIIGLGITGSVRGVNFDDHRPDLIVVDDVMDEENSATPEQREKIYSLVMGSLRDSLAERVDTPHAKMVLLNTPQDFSDLSQKASEDAEFVSATFGCWTKATENLPAEFRVSAWEERVSSEELRAQRSAAIARNRLSLFVREKECKIIAPENSAFKSAWLHYFGPGESIPEPPLEEMFSILVVDPVPPPSEDKLRKGKIDGDFEAITALGLHNNAVYVLETQYMRGHNPQWTSTTFFEMAHRWRVKRAVVETVAYQRTLVWLLKEAMKRSGQYIQIRENTGDRRSKEQRISDGINGVASSHQLFVRRSQDELISQFTHFSLIKKIGHDDVLETVAVGCADLLGLVPSAFSDRYSALDDKSIPDLDYSGGCP